MNRKLLPLLLLLSVLWTNAYSDHLSSSILFSARLSGENEVPEVNTNGQGVAFFTFDEKKSTLYFSVSLSNLSTPITGMHIHEGPPGENGPVIINLVPFLNGNRAKGAIQNVTRATIAKMLTGAYYINVHTENNPGGEIRGQVELETDTRFTALLSGANEVPAVASQGQGLFIANLSHSRTLLTFNSVFRGLSSPVIGAHIHNAATGENGPVILDLTDSISENTISGTWYPSDFLAALLAGELYINIHTADNPGGEIRGQLLVQEGLQFDVILNGDQENPPIDLSARGAGIITVSPDLSTLDYYILFDSLSGPAEGAHFHLANLGMNGGVAIDLSDHILGNVIEGSTPITIDFLNRLLAGGVYLNIHTEANQGGEIRGQVYKLAREPYVFDMNGGQEVPPNSSTATGAGFVTIDRDQTNAHFMIVYNGLQSDFTASHFHRAPPGVNGPVIFNLTDDFNDFGGAYGYWDHEDASPFNASPLFRENEVYVNVHSMGLPGGEIRGNVTRARDLFTEVPFNPQFGNNLMLLAEMTGSQEVPPVTTDVIGVGTVYFNEDRTKAFVNVTVDGLSGPITGAHIHDGAFGENGPVLFPLTFLGNRIQTEITKITPEELGKLLGGQTYINVHTLANPGGEIRGQLFLEQDLTFISLILGEFEVDPVVTDARGLGTFHYTIGTLSLDVNIQLTELSSNITGAHLHRAAFGENGPVVIGLDSLRDGNRYQGRVNLTFDDYAALLTNNLYVNIHTDTNPTGEIRGQLFFANGLVFDGWMSGLQEIPFATTTASGLAVALVSNDLSRIDALMVTDGVSGTIGQSHFHMAAQGSNGSVIQDLTPSLNDNDIINFFTAPSTQLVDALLSGNIYINAHTPAFPGGELRGQMYRLARDGYGFDMCPQQEINPVNAPLAQGSGAVSIDRLHENFNVAFATTGLTGPVTGAHFHVGEIGVSGPVVFNFTPFLENGALFGYGVPSSDSALIPSILDGDIYVNVHTTAHGGGEIRGQVVKESLCTIETGIDELAHIVNEVSLSPVPVFESLHVAIDIHTSASLSMNVLDMSGKLISSDQYSLTEGENTVEINTSNLHSGFYILMISDGQAAQAYKFVK